VPEGDAAGLLPEHPGGHALVKPQPADQDRGGEVAGDELHGMQGADLVVPVGDDQHGGCGTEPAGQEPEQVQGGLVGPVDVLDHQHRRHPCVQQPVEQGGEQHLPGCLFPEQLVEPAAERGGDVGQRAVRAGGWSTRHRRPAGFGRRADAGPRTR
jgi:hypothetical protein